MKYGLYEVVGRREYRGHKPGEQFEASLDPAAAQRAIARGDIKLIREITPTIQEHSIRPPEDWLTPLSNRDAARRLTRK